MGIEQKSTLNTFRNIVCQAKYYGVQRSSIPLQTTSSSFQQRTLWINYPIFLQEFLSCKTTLSLLYETQTGEAYKGILMNACYGTVYRRHPFKPDGDIACVTYLELSWKEGTADKDQFYMCHSLSSCAKQSKNSPLDLRFINLSVLKRFVHFPNCRNSKSTGQNRAAEISPLVEI